MAITEPFHGNEQTNTVGTGVGPIVQTAGWQWLGSFEGN